MNKQPVLGPYVEVKLHYLPGKVLALVDAQEVLNRVAPLIADYLRSDNLVADVKLSESYDLVLSFKQRKE